MSTVIEVIAAVHGGMQVLGLSCITNMAAGMLPQKLTAEEVFETADRVRPQFSRVVRAVVRHLSDSAPFPRPGPPATMGDRSHEDPRVS
jgi:purine-nucleoside phosphorylase